MDWVSMIFSFYPPFAFERWWGLDPSEFRDMKEKERIIKEEMHAEESTWTFAIIWPKANNFGQKKSPEIDAEHVWVATPLKSGVSSQGDEYSSWGEKKVVCNVKSSSHAFPAPFSPFILSCVIVLFLTHSHCLSETKRRWRMRSTKGGRILSWRRWRHLEKCQKSWMQELRNSLVTGGDGFSTHRMENGLRMEILEMTNSEEGMKIRMISDEKKVRDFQRLGSYSQLTTRLTSDDRTGSSPCGTWGWNRDRESRHAQQRWLLCLHDLRPQWHTHLAVKFDRWEVWEGWILY